MDFDLVNYRRQYYKTPPTDFFFNSIIFAHFVTHIFGIVRYYKPYYSLIAWSVWILIQQAKTFGFYFRILLGQSDTAVSIIIIMVEALIRTRRSK